MIVKVETDGTVRLVDAADMRRFSIMMPDTEAARVVLASLARPDGPGHAWIAPDRVRALAMQASAQHTGPGWDEQFAAMVAYAASKGWTDAAGALRAHIAFDGASA